MFSIRLARLMRSMVWGLAGRWITTSVQRAPGFRECGPALPMFTVHRLPRADAVKKHCGLMPAGIAIRTNFADCGCKARRQITAAIAVATHARTLLRRT